jgi:hypothetical protein
LEQRGLAGRPSEFSLGGLACAQEACFICKGPDGAAAIMKMNGAAQDALWAAVEKSEAQRYHEVLAGLRVAPTSKQGAIPAVPVRLLVPASQGEAWGPGRREEWGGTSCEGPRRDDVGPLPHLIPLHPPALPPHASLSRRLADGRLG